MVDEEVSRGDVLREVVAEGRRVEEEVQPAALRMTTTSKARQPAELTFATEKGPRGATWARRIIDELEQSGIDGMSRSVSATSFSNEKSFDLLNESDELDWLGVEVVTSRGDGTLLVRCH